MKNYLLFLTFFFCSSLFAFDCTHYFLEANGKYVKSNKLVGTDVGWSKGRPNSGRYHCILEGGEEKKYLYIGEVGDSSRLEIKGNNKTFTVHHGLRDDGDVYTRYVPFFVDLSNLDLKKPIEFELYYKDLFPFQTGLRSGKPSLEDFNGVVKRVLDRSVMTIFHVFQIFALVSLMFSILLRGRKGYGKGSRLVLCSLGAASLLQLTGIPRSFFPVEVSMRLNDYAQILFWVVSGVMHFDVIYFEKKKTAQLLFLSCGLISLTCLELYSGRDQIYAYLYSGAILLCTTFPSIFLTYGLQVHKITLRSIGVTPRQFQIYLLLFSFVFLHDAVNLAFLHSANYYVSHFLIFVPVCFFSDYIYSCLEKSEMFFRRKIEEVKRGMLSPERQGEKHFSSLAKDLSISFSFERVSFLLFKEGQGKILGSYGKFKDVHKVIDLSSTLKLSQIGPESQGVVYTSEEDGGGIILALNLEDDARMFACFSNCNESGKFLDLNEKLTIFEYELSEALRSLYKNLVLIEKEKILELFINHVHPLQLESQNFFLQNFNISDEAKGNHFFVYGDVVDSVTLNDRFGADNIRTVLETQLSFVWERVKKYGCVINIKDGDSFSFIVPRLAGEAKDKFSNRLLNILDIVNEMMLKGQSFIMPGIVDEVVKHKFVCSLVSEDLSEGSSSLKNLRVLASNEIDLAARFLEKIAHPGEIIISESLYQFMEEKKHFVEIDTFRCKGKSKTAKGFLFIRDAYKEVG